MRFHAMAGEYPIDGQGAGPQPKPPKLYLCFGVVPGGGRSAADDVSPLFDRGPNRFIETDFGGPALNVSGNYLLKDTRADRSAFAQYSVRANT